MGEDYYNDTGEDGTLELDFHVVDEDGETLGREAVLVDVPADSRVYVDQILSDEVRER